MVSDNVYGSDAGQSHVMDLSVLEACTAGALCADNKGNNSVTASPNAAKNRTTTVTNTRAFMTGNSGLHLPGSLWKGIPTTPTALGGIMRITSPHRRHLTSHFHCKTATARSRTG